MYTFIILQNLFNSNPQKYSSQHFNFLKLKVKLMLMLDFGADFISKILFFLVLTFFSSEDAFFPFNSDFFCISRELVADFFIESARERRCFGCFKRGDHEKYHCSARKIFSSESEIINCYDDLITILHLFSVPYKPSALLHAVISIKNIYDDAFRIGNRIITSDDLK